MDNKQSYLKLLDGCIRMLPRPEELIPAGSAPGTSQLGSVRSAKPVPASTIALEGKGRPAA